MFVVQPPHDCKTTFANGINIFRQNDQPVVIAAPIVPRRGPLIKNYHILALLEKSKKELCAREVANELDGCYKSIGATLLRMAEAGLIMKTFRKSFSGKPTPYYSLWREE